MGAYENLNRVGGVALTVQAFVLWAMAALVVVRMVADRRSPHARRRRASAAFLAACLALGGFLVMDVSRGADSFSRLFRAFTAGSVMASPFL